MDAVWWKDYKEQYDACVTAIYRLMAIRDDPPLDIDEVFHFGLFYGMTSRIIKEHGIFEEEK